MKNISAVRTYLAVAVLSSILSIGVFSYFKNQGSTSVNSSSSSSSSQNSNSDNKAVDTTSGFKATSWGNNVTISYADGKIQYKSNGLPNHVRQAMYALPNAGVRVPDAKNATAGADPTKAQNYDFKITTNPQKADKTTSASLGTIGVMISGAALFNPYEGDGSTVATASNFTVKDSNGNDVAFLDACSGHPNPMGSYHYHALPKCVTETVDKNGGPSHIIGIAFDGFPIYGDKDMDGKQIVASQLDSCNGITSKTPEFPDGIYHYVLLDSKDFTSSIRCFSGTVDPSLTQMNGGMMMQGMPPMDGDKKGMPRANN